jgi:hypothetical protein
MAQSEYFGLRTPADLFDKLKHDYGRLRADPMDSYAAFDFFVTAFHIDSWLRANGRTVTPSPGYESALWEVCEQLANGLKHFGRSRDNRVIEGTTRKEGAFNSQVFDSAVFDVGRLEVQLHDTASKELGASVDVITLAQRVFAYWEGKLAEVK